MASSRGTGDEEPRVVIRPWSSLAFRDFRLYWTSTLFSGVSRHMRDMLNYYLVYEISGSAVQLGLTGLFQAIPVLALGMLGGALADAVNRKKLLVLTNTVGLVPPFAVALLVFTGHLQVWHLWVFTSLTSAVGALGRPAQRALIPRLVPRTHVLNAVTLNSAPTEGTMMVGPLIAGALTALLGVGYAYGVNGLFQLVALLMFVAIRTSGAVEGDRRTSPIALLRSLVDGFRFMRRQEVVLAGGVLDFGVMAVGTYRVVLPILAKDVLGVGVTGLGFLHAAPAVGAVLATVALLWVGEVRRNGALTMVAYLGYAVFLVLLGLAEVFWLALVAGVGLGAVDMATYIFRQSLLQLSTPDEYRGRSTGTAQILSNLGGASGAMEMGFAAALLGAPGALLLGGGLSVAMVLGIHLRWPSLWNHRA